MLFLFSSRRRHTRSYGDWSSDVCSSDLGNTCVPGQTRPSRKTLNVGQSNSGASDDRGRCRAANTDGAWPADGHTKTRPGMGKERSEERRVGKECRSMSCLTRYME